MPTNGPLNARSGHLNAAWSLLKNMQVKGRRQNAPSNPTNARSAGV